MKRSAIVVTTVLTLATVPATLAWAGPLTVSAPVQVSPTNSPFAGAGPKGAPCNGVPGNLQAGTNFPGTEVEPWVAASPSDPDRLIGGWQQDRWSDGGANANLAAYSADGGATWQVSVPPHARCTGGTYERNSDPWTAISPNGTAYFMTLAFNNGAENFNNAMIVSRSADGGATWGPATVLREDTSPNVLNDKNSMTADRLDSNYAYAIWDRLEFPNEQAAQEAGEHAVGYRGPTWFARTTNGGASWEPARIIYDPGQVNQTIGNQIVQTASGTLVNGFNLIYNFKNAHKVRGMNIAYQRSTDRGTTWTDGTIIDKLNPVQVRDPSTGAPVRTGDILPEIAADPGNETVYMVWQDGRTTGGAFSQLALAKSTNGGQSWTNLGYSINPVDTTHAFNPAISIQPDGTVGILYQDFRNDDAAAPLVTSTWLLHSHDGGVTWTETKVGADFDLTGAPVARGFFPGDYHGLAAVPTGFVPFYPVTTGPQAQNIYAAVATD